MSGRYCCIAAVFALLLFAPVTSLEAQWIENGVHVSTSDVNAPYPTIISDGEGGAIIAWVENPDPFSTDILAQRVDGMGNIMWSQGGVAVCTAAGYQFGVEICSDGAGGAIIVWDDNRSGDYDIYAQRLDPDGNVLWTVDGIAICDTTSGQFGAEICPDGEGGVVICWTDQRDGNYDIYAQKIDSGGIVQWTANGVVVCNDLSTQYGNRVAHDGRGGAFFVWYDDRNGDNDIFLRAIDTDGIPDLEREICVTIGDQRRPDIISDGEGGAFIAWQDARSGNVDIYAQRIDYSGNGIWGSLGIAVCTVAEGQTNPRIAPAEYGGLYITWVDYRNSGTTYFDIYFQKLSAYGNLEWTPNGIQVCVEEGNQEFPEIIADGDGGAIIAWKDGRNVNSDIFAQRFNDSGGLMWGYNGVPVVAFSWTQGDVKLASDGMGGAIFVWDDFRNFAPEAFAQRIERNGYWGYPSPSINEVRDVPGDQGGYLNLAWDASRLDPWPDEDISTYSVWRAISETQAALFMQDGRRVLTAMSGFDPRSDEQVIRMELAGGRAFYWEEIAVVDARYLETYSLVVPALFDSTGVSSEYHYFQVIAHGLPVADYWISAPDSGHSVDNLAPAMPLNLAGDQSVIPEGLELFWDPNSEFDLANYRVYRGLTDDFDPGPSNLIASPVDTMAFDGDWRWDGGFFYKVSAVDIHGNESQYALLGPTEVTGDDVQETPVAAYLGQNFPNPFNPVTTIRFGLAEPSHVSLRIYDAAGRLLRVLVDERMDADRHEVTWNGLDGAGRTVSSGIYFYSITSGAFMETKKMVLMR